ncbi:MAG: OmpA family protein [Alphaproteobacteria bacterium]
MLGFRFLSARTLYLWSPARCPSKRDEIGLLRSNRASQGSAPVKKEEYAMLQGFPLSSQATFGRFHLSVALLLASLSPGVSLSAMAADKAALVTEVHFDPGSTAITPGGHQKIERAITALLERNPSEIRVIGFTDSTGPDAINLKISRSRAENVAEVLVKEGIKIPLVVEGRGEKGAPYKIDDDVSEPLNRCVGIIAVGGDNAQKPLL